MDTQTADQVIDPGPAESSVGVQDCKRNFSWNTSSQIVFFVFNAVTSMVMVPFLKDHLGVAGYGMVFLAGQIANWTQLVSTAVEGGLGRFVLLHLARGEVSKARAYFGTQFTAVTWTFALLLPVITAIAYYSPVLFQVPRGQDMQCRAIFFSTFFSFLLWLFMLAFSVSTYVRQRFYIKNFIDISNQTVRYGTWIVLFSVLTPALWHVGLGYVLGSATAVVATILVFRKLTPELWSRRRAFDRAKFREVTSMGSWVSAGQLGAMLYLYADAAVINKVLGPESVGKYGAIAGLAIMLRTFSGSLLSLIGPSIIAYYAKQDYEAMANVTIRSIKFVSLALSVVLGIGCGLSAPFLTWWLGPEFGKLNIILWVLLAHLVFNMSMDPPATVPAAMNKLAPQSIATAIGGALKFVLALCLLKFTTLGLLSVAVADLIGLSAKNLIFQPVYVSSLLKTSSWRMYKSLIPACFVFPAVAMMSLWMSRAFPLDTFARLALAGMLLLAVSGGLTYLAAFNQDDRRFMLEVTPLRRLRRRHS